MGIIYFLSRLEEYSRKVRKGVICLLVFSLCVFIYYNGLFFQQIFSHYFYQPVKVKAIVEKGTKLRCLMVSYGGVPYSRNANPFGPQKVKDEYHYKIGDKDYKSQVLSYIRETDNCRKQAETIYYFPLIPSWSVVINDFPSKGYWNNFYRSLFYFLIVSWSCLALILMGGKKDSKKISTDEITYYFRCSLASIVLGLLSLMPFLGMLSVPGVSLGLFAFIKSNNRTGFLGTTLSLLGAVKSPYLWIVMTVLIHR